MHNLWIKVVCSSYISLVMFSTIIDELQNISESQNIGELQNIFNLNVVHPFYYKTRQ